MRKPVPESKLEQLQKLRGKMNKLCDTWKIWGWIDGDFNEYLLPLEKLCCEAMCITARSGQAFLVTSCAIQAALDLCRLLVSQINTQLFTIVEPREPTPYYLSIHRLSKIVASYGQWYIHVGADAAKDEEDLYYSEDYNFEHALEAAVVLGKIDELKVRYYPHWV
ncbi:unnamed protein product [Periconia digitata]|uniref:Uncharacterized protein n=1 Tax=Periconia digitata TaxID=1303443 RepID=A0A9W4U8U1_9PLEO|nr:unnamed protein product [Periconia digitata]